jgi:hypothetical protein
MKKTGSAMSMQEALKSVDYKMWFTDEYAKDYLEMLQKGFLHSHIQGRLSILDQTSTLLAMYSILIYKLYPVHDELRNEIESDQQLKANFQMIKGWLDQNDGDRIADETMKLLEQAE